MDFSQGFGFRAASWRSGTSVAASQSHHEHDSPQGSAVYDVSKTHLGIKGQVSRWFNPKRGVAVSENPSINSSNWFARIAFVCLLTALFAFRASADPVGVTYTVSGSSGAWILDFSVTNDLNVGQDVYLFGVSLPAQDIVASPTGWTNCSIGPCFSGTTFNPGVPLPSGINLNGPNVTFNNYWHEPLGTSSSDAIASGETLSGFEVEVNSILPPTSVEWFATGVDNTPDGTAPYTGGGEFMISGDCLAVFGVTCAVQDEENPGFVGTATTPEPSSGLLLGTSLFALVALPRRRLINA